MTPFARGFGLGFLVGIGVSAAAVVVVIGAFLMRVEPTPSVRLYSPERVTLNEEFEIQLVALNPGDEEVEVQSVDVDEGFLEGFLVLGVAPPPTDSMTIPLVNQRSWFFERRLAPGDSLTIRFRLQAERAGNFFGRMDVCNPNQDCATVSPNVDVIPARSP